MYHEQFRLTAWQLANKRVFLRADLNVPCDNDTILDDFRLQAVVPTLTYLLEHDAKVIVASHFGLSTNALILWFKHHGFPCALDPQAPLSLLGNVRFFEDQELIRIAQHCDYYVTDAWGTLHRNEYSITGLPALFSPEKRSYGFLVHQELHHLQPALDRTKKMTLFLGGSKFKDKLTAAIHLLPRLNAIALLPPLSCQIAAALGEKTGASLTDPTLYELARQFYERAQQLQKPVIMPRDYLCGYEDRWGSLRYASAQHLAPHDFCIAVGPETLTLYQKLIQDSDVIACFGLMGFIDQPETCTASQALLHNLSTSHAYSILGGGDSHALYQRITPQEPLAWISTGGGSTLHYLASGNLVGLDAL